MYIVKAVTANPLLFIILKGLAPPSELTALFFIFGGDRFRQDVERMKPQAGIRS